MSGPTRNGSPRVELEHGAAEQDADVPLTAQNEPRGAEDLRVARQHAPASLHAHVVAEHDAALESEEQVLADSANGFEPAAVERRRELLDGRARVRRLDFELLADEHL